MARMEVPVVLHHGSRTSLFPCIPACATPMRAMCATYFDWLMRFEPTLSPLNLLPSAADFDRSFQWGWAQADVMIPFLRKALEPVSWELASP